MSSHRSDHICKTETDTKKKCCFMKPVSYSSRIALKRDFFICSLVRIVKELTWGWIHSTVRFSVKAALWDDTEKSHELDQSVWLTVYTVDAWSLSYCMCASWFSTDGNKLSGNLQSKKGMPESSTAYFKEPLQCSEHASQLGIDYWMDERQMPL